LGAGLSGVVGSARSRIGGSRPVGRDALLLPARLAWRRAWLRRGVPATVAVASTSALVVAPHPDDETLGCGVAIMRKRDAGRPVDIVIVSDGALAEPAVGSPAEMAALRVVEARRACARLGVDEEHVHFLDFPDAGVAEHLDAVADALGALITRLRPEQLLIPVSCEGHPDHDATNRAARAAAVRIAYPGRVLEYPVWLWTHWPWTAGYGQPAAGRRVTRLLLDPVDRVREVRPLLVDASGYRDRQRVALAEHASQITPSGGPRSLPESLLSATRARYEIYLPAGSLDHLARPAPGPVPGP
jgi:LmbE family N-acetylglucosaminyl deacetylase